MPGTRCAVYGCNNTYKKRQEGNEDFIFHRFPKAKDIFSQTIREKWIFCCQRKDKFNPDTSYMCSVHFTENDYERDLQNELLGLPLRKILKKSVVPTLTYHEKKPLGNAGPSSTSFRGESLAKRSEKEEESKLLEAATLPTSNNTISDDNQETNTKSVKRERSEETIPGPSSSSTPQFGPENNDYNSMYNDISPKYDKLEKQNALLKSNSKIKSRKIKRLNEQLKYFKNNCYRSTPETSAYQKNKAASD